MTSSPDLSRQLVVISGASSGIGLTVARHLAAIGYTVVAGTRRQADASTVLDGASDSARLLPTIFDVTNADQIAALVETISGLEAKGYTLRAVFSNAGITAYLGDTSCEGTPISTLQHVMEVNYLGATRFIQALLPKVRASRGTVIVNSAMMAHVVLPFSAGYAPSKAALEAWTDSLRRETNPFGVRVVMLELGGIATHIAEGQAADPMRSDNYPAEEAVATQLASMGKHANDPKFAPERVAELIERILETDKPKSRYWAGGGAKFLGVLGYLPERVQDVAMAQMFKPKR